MSLMMDKKKLSSPGTPSKLDVLANKLLKQKESLQDNNNAPATPTAVTEPASDVPVKSRKGRKPVKRESDCSHDDNDCDIMNKAYSHLYQQRSPQNGNDVINSEFPPDDPDEDDDVNNVMPGYVPNIYGEGFSDNSRINNNHVHSKDPTQSLPRKHKCDLCSYDTDNRSHLRRHIDCVHLAFKPYGCYVCGCTFSRSEKFKDHFQQSHPDAMYSLEQARREPGSPSPAEQGQDGQVFPAESRASDYSSRQFPCPFCVYAGKDSWHLKRHIADVHDRSNSLICVKCGYRTSRRHRLVSHMKIHGELTCLYCPYATTEHSAYAQHMKTCTEINKVISFPCTVCPDVFTSTKQLNAHFLKEHAAHSDDSMTSSSVPFSPDPAYSPALPASTRPPTSFTRQDRTTESPLLPKKKAKSSDVTDPSMVCAVCGRQFKYGRSYQKHITYAHQPFS